MAAVKPSPRSLFALLLAPCAAADSSKRRAGEATFRTGLQTVYTQAWPGGTRAHAPHLHVRDADPGQLPPCAQSEPLFWMHLAGLLRSFEENAEHLLTFLNRSSACWFLVLYTPDVRDSAMSSWRRSGASNTALDDPGRAVRGALSRFQSAPRGGAGFAVAARSHEGASASGAERFVHLAAHQNFGASVLLARSIARHHRARMHPADIVLVTRPDVAFHAPIDAGKLRRVFKVAVTARRPAPPLLMVSGQASITSNDPMGDAVFYSRAALDRLCPAGEACRDGEGPDDGVACGHFQKRWMSARTRVQPISHMRECLLTRLGRPSTV